MTKAATSFGPVSKLAATKSTASAAGFHTAARVLSDLDSSTEMVILPDPVGHHMLVALPTFAEQTAGGIIIPGIVNERERAATVVGTVLAMGSSCYKDKMRFPDGAWCKVGDTVLFSRYQGMRFKSKDIESGEMVEYRMLTDDGIVGVVPEGAQVGAL